MNCTVTVLRSVPDGTDRPGWRECERPMGHGGLHRYTHDTWKSEPPTRTVVEFTTDGKAVGLAVIEGVWIV